MPSHKLAGDCQRTDFLRVSYSANVHNVLYKTTAMVAAQRLLSERGSNII